MEYGDFERELHIDASPEVVFEVLSSPEHMRDWWEAESEFAPATGEVRRLTWTNGETGEVQSAPFTIVQSEPPRLFAFRWTHEEGETAGPGNSLLTTFELTPTGNGTTLKVRESGYRERGWEAAVLEAHYKNHQSGWNYFLPRLVAAANQVASK